MIKYHNCLACIAVLGVDNIGDAITLHAHNALGHYPLRIHRRPYKDDITGTHLAESRRDSLSKDQVTGKVESGEHAGAIRLQTHQIIFPQLRHQFYKLVNNKDWFCCGLFEHLQEQQCRGRCWWRGGSRGIWPPTMFDRMLLWRNHSIALEIPTPFLCLCETLRCYKGFVAFLI